MWKCPNLLIRNSFTVGGGVCAQEECLPMGMCPGVCLTRGVSAGECQRGGVFPGGGCPGGVSAQGGVHPLDTVPDTPHCMLGYTHPCPLHAGITLPPPEKE